MGTFIKGAGKPYSKGYALYKKNNETEYTLIDSKKVGMAYFADRGGLNSDGTINDDTTMLHTPMLAIEDLVDAEGVHPTTHAIIGCVSTPYFEGAVISPSLGSYPNPPFIAFYTEKGDYNSCMGGVLYPEHFDWDNLLARLKENPLWEKQAKYIVFSVKATSPDVNGKGMYVNLRNVVNFCLDEYPDQLTAGQTHQLVVRSIGEGGVDLDGDGVIWVDSKDSNVVEYEV